MNLQDPSQQYLQTQIETISPGKLILMVYDGTLTFLEEAAERLKRGDWEGKGEMIFRAQGCITELMCCLNMEAGEIAQLLYKLYEYLNWRLAQANALKNLSGITEVIELMSTLREGWEGAVKKVEMMR